MLYVGNRIVSPGFVVENESGGGDVVNAKNYTGSTVSTGDKVFLNYQTDVVDDYASETTTVYNIYPCLSGDGDCFTYASASNTSGIKYINSIADSDFTVITSNGLYQYSNYTTSYPCIVRYTPDGKAIRNYSNTMQCISANWWTVNSCSFLGFDLGTPGFTNSSPYNIYLLDMNNGGILSTISLGGSNYYSSTCAIAASDSEIYSFGNLPYYITIDRQNLTGTRSNCATSGTIGTVYSFGVTTDKKYIVGCTGKIPSDSQSLKLIEIVSAGSVRNVGADEVIPELGYWMTSNKAFAFTFNPNNGILCCADCTSKVYGFYRYDSVAHSWSVVNINLDAVISDIDNFAGQITVNNDLTRALICYKPTGVSATYSRVIALENNIGFVADAYSWPAVNSETLTGYVTTGGAAGADIEVTTILPETINVTVTVNANDAEISGGIE